jgi:anaerobic selenocysteine-containing dehydrogenase
MDPVLPNTDAALQLAIIYVWLTEDLYDKEYVKPTWSAWIRCRLRLGKEDGVAKTPAWASKKCGVPEWTIKALAREFADKTTSIAHYFGGGLFVGPIPMNRPLESSCWACRAWAVRACITTS